MPPTCLPLPPCVMPFSSRRWARPTRARSTDWAGRPPLTSKVAVVGPSTRPDADVDYLFLQVVVDEARVDANQNCGNMLAAVGPFALERGLLPVAGEMTAVRIHMVNTSTLAIATVQTPRRSGYLRGRRPHRRRAWNSCSHSDCVPGCGRLKLWGAAAHRPDPGSGRGRGGHLHR